MMVKTDSWWVVEVMLPPWKCWVRHQVKFTSQKSAETAVIIFATNLIKARAILVQESIYQPSKKISGRNK